MSNNVKRRETFYLAGYDPRGARHYHNLYKEQSALQTNVNGIKMDISARTRVNKYIQSWQINSSSTGLQTKTNYHCLAWDDVIRAHWKKNFIALFFDLFYILRRYVASGIIVKYAKVAPTQMIAAFYPVVFLFVTLACSYYLSSVVYTWLSPLATMLPALLLALVVAYGVIQFFIYLGNKMAVFWLLRIYVFSLKYVDHDIAYIEERSNAFASYIAEIIQNHDKNEIDEILFVAHSVGTIMIIPILVKAFSLLEMDEKVLAKISIVTLGECIPIVSFLPKAKDYRAAMQTLSTYHGIYWLDYTAAIDGACFPLMDFYKESAVEVDNGMTPHYLSPRFHTLFSKQNYETLRKNRYKTHFLYLMSCELKGVYDFFKITAGHQRLKDTQESV